MSHNYLCGSFIGYFQPSASFVAQAIKKTNLNDYVFVNQRSRFKDKRYTLESLGVLWKKACAEVGETIDLYSGLKHSTCSQMINEKGLTLNQVQMVTDHANIESVRKYAKVELDIKRRLMEAEPVKRDETKIIQIGKG